MTPRPAPARICHFFALTQLGGSELGAREYIKRQPDFEHDIVFLMSAGPAVDYYADAGLPVRCLKLDRTGWRHASSALSAHLQEHDPDLIHAYGLRPSLLVRCRRHRPRLIQAIHSLDVHRPGWQVALDRLTAGQVDRFIANSATGADFLVRHRGVDAARTAVVHNGIDTSPFARNPEAGRTYRAALGIPAAARIIVTVANLRQPKALDVLIDAATTVCTPTGDVHWIIAGDGPEHAWLAAQIADRSLQNTVHLVGFRSEVAPLLWAADIFCLTSRREGVPVAILEAMAAGLPVVATDVGGVHELVDAGTTGTLVAAGDAAAIVGALQPLITDESRRRRFGDAGAERARRHFGIDRAATELAQHYRELLDNDAPR